MVTRVEIFLYKNTDIIIISLPCLRPSGLLQSHTTAWRVFLKYVLV